MKSVMSCTSSNSISQGSTIGLNGFLLLSSRYHCKIHPDLNMPDDVRSQRSSFSFTSKASLKPYSLILSAALLELLHSLLSSLMLHVLPMHVFNQDLCVHSLFTLLHQSAGRKENIKARNFNAGSVATCITSRQKLCCCQGIDINRPFQSLPNSELLSAPLLFLFIQRLLETMHMSCRMNPLELGSMVEIDITTLIIIVTK